jgi:hypothetical protein
MVSSQFSRAASPHTACLGERAAMPFQSILKCCVTQEIAVRWVLAMGGVECRPR